MPTMLELPTVAKYLASVLTTGAPGAAIATYFGTRIHHGTIAPQGTALPHLLYFEQFADDDYCMPSAYQGTELTYFVKGVAIALQYQSVLLPGLAAVNAALQAQILVGTVLDGFVFQVQGAEKPREYEDVQPGGQMAIHYGRSWQLSVEPS